jgi:hypothetical protein
VPGTAHEAAAMKASRRAKHAVASHGVSPIWTSCEWRLLTLGSCACVSRARRESQKVRQIAKTPSNARLCGTAPQLGYCISAASTRSCQAEQTRHCVRAPRLGELTQEEMHRSVTLPGPDPPLCVRLVQRHHQRHRRLGHHRGSETTRRRRTRRQVQKAASVAHRRRTAARWWTRRARAEREHVSQETHVLRRAAAAECCWRCRSAREGVGAVYRTEVRAPRQQQSAPWAV